MLLELAMKDTLGSIAIIPGKFASDSEYLRSTELN